MGELIINTPYTHRHDGGDGSGNWGHEGVIGQWGGSAPGGGNKYRTGERGSYKQSQKNSARKPKEPNFKDKKVYDDFMSEKKAEIERIRKAHKEFVNAHWMDTKFDTEAAVEKMEAEMRPINEQMQNATLKRFDNVYDCTSASDVADYINAQDYFHQSRDGSRGTNLDGLDLPSAVMVYTAVEKTFEAVPEMKGNIGGIRTEKLSKNVYAHAELRPYKGSSSVVLNSTRFKSGDNLVENYENDVEYGFHPKGTDASAIVTHELAHCFDNILAYKKGLQWMTFPSYDWIRGAKTESKIPMKRIKEGISEYAKTNDMECFAEAFAESVHSYFPRKECLAVVDQFRKDVKKYM